MAQVVHGPAYSGLYIDRWSLFTGGLEDRFHCIWLKEHSFTYPACTLALQ